MRPWASPNKKRGGEEEMVGMGKKHFVLVHGIGHGPWCWYKLATLLRAAGHRVTAHDLAASGVHPRRLDEVESFADYAKPLMELMASLPPHERAVLVGHSYGGFFEGHPLEAYMDSKVEISDDPRNGSVAFGHKYLSTRMYQLSPPEDITLATALLRPASFFFSDLNKIMVLTEEKYGSVSQVFIVCKQDEAMVEDFQRWMIKRSPGAEVKEIDGADHMVMLSKPKELCDILLEIADKHQ